MALHSHQRCWPLASSPPCIHDRLPRRQQLQRQHVCRASRTDSIARLLGEEADSPQLWTPGSDPSDTYRGPEMRGASTYAPSRGGGRGRMGRRQPPDLPSMLLSARVVYLGMPLVPAVTELILAEMWYLQIDDDRKPINLYINSTGTTRADGETVLYCTFWHRDGLFIPLVGFETEGTAIYDMMKHLSVPVYTVDIGVAVGQSCMLLAAGAKGHRFMLEHATAMLQQPRLPPTGQRQAIEVHIKWREVLAQKQSMLGILSEATGNTPEKLDQDMQRPLYMTPRDAIEYGIIDKVLKGGTDEQVSQFVGPAGSASASPDGAASAEGFSPGQLNKES